VVPTSPVGLALAPPLYLSAIIEYLRNHEADLWSWFSVEGSRVEQDDAIRLELLRSTYRLTREASRPIFEAVDDVCIRLGLDVPVSCYQAQLQQGNNVGLAYIPGEIHVIFAGDAAKSFTPAELRSVVGHELWHYVLLYRWHDFAVAAALLEAMANDARASSSHEASVRLFRLYTECYCDRASYLVVGELEPTIAALVKLQTGAGDVSAASYLEQVDEVYRRGHPCSEGLSHPEMFIRARALADWAAHGAEADHELGMVIEGPMRLTELDLLGQQRVCQLTRRLILAFLTPSWLQTELLIAHARLFFDDFVPDSTSDPELARELAAGDEHLLDYFCYVLLDLVAADAGLDDGPLAAALRLSDELGLGERFRRIATKELKLRKKRMAALEAELPAILARAACAAQPDEAVP